MLKKFLLLVALLLVFAGSFAPSKGLAGEPVPCFLVGHSHIDAVWLWTRDETLKVCRETFPKVLDILDKHPDVYYSQSSAQYYEWMEKNNPEIFERIKEKVKQGNWEIVGGMWIEPDGNLPCGESFARQLLYGKKYFLDKFGVDVKVGWLPDSFGYCWTLPQIFKKAGIDYFLTSMATYGFLSEEQRKAFGYNNFWWESPDGSKILTTRSAGPYVQGIDAELMKQEYDFQNLHNPSLDTLIYIYGEGDHGGGLTEEMVQSGEAMNAKPAGFKTKFTKAADYFNDLEGKSAGFPVLNDEIYCEYFKGVYTTQANTKKNNRQNECLLLGTEIFSSIADLLNTPYPKENLLGIWKLMMFNQFHDILPGSAIKEVYADVDKDHEIIRTGLKNILNDSLKTISSSINTAGEGTPVIIFNPLSWDRMGLVKVPLSELGINEPVTIKDSSGIEIPSQVIEEDGKKLIFVAQNIPSLGYAEYRAIPSKDGSIPSTSLTATSSVLENELFKVEVDPLTGWIKTIFDKTASREVLDGKGKGNSLQLFKDDPPDYAAWSLDENIQKNKFSEPPVKGMEITVVEKGPVRSILRVKHIYKKSVFTQDIILYHKIQIIDFCTRVDWNQKYTCLKAAFPSSISNTFATYEIPYGFIDRKLSNAPGATERDAQKWEVNAQQWIDYTDGSGSYGLSLLNNSKYGFDVRDNSLRITLLRSPDHPTPIGPSEEPLTVTDQGKHEISYALYPDYNPEKERGIFLFRKEAEMKTQD